MKKLFLLLFLAIANFSQAQTAALSAADYARAETFLAPKVYPLVANMRIAPVWLESGRFWYVVRSNGKTGYVLADPKTGQKKTSMRLTELLAGETGLKNAAPADPLEALSPDGKKTAFIKNHNLWVKDLASGKENALTTDGIQDFGYATDNAGWKHTNRAILRWSPDSKKIATFKQDQRHVRNMYLVKTTVGAPELEQWKYPLPGDSAIILIHRVIIDVENAETIPLKLAADAHRSTLCDDISCEDGEFTDTEWSRDGTQLAFVSTTRDHKQATLRVANAATGEVRTVFEEKVPTQYESGRDGVCWRFLPESNEFIWYSQKDNWGHLYLHDLKTGKLKKQITKGNFVVTNILNLDTKNRRIFFAANGREAGNNPYFSHFYSIGFDGNNLKWLTPETGHHEISLSPDGNYFIDHFSQPDVAGINLLKDKNGRQIAALATSDISALKKNGWKPPTVFTVKSNNQRFDLYGLMFTPTTLDKTKKYPVVIYIYPGPQGGTINYWGFLPARGDAQAMAELGFVVIHLEGSCNPNRSKDFHDACYGNMVENTLPDHMAALKQLAQKFPFLDIDKTGIWGHSGGGFATATALLRYPDFFKVGVSQSGNHDNRNYEDDWGERYIGLLKENNDGSSNYSVQSNQSFAKNLKGKLLIAHGGLDDNVPPYNAYLLADALIKANKDFDLIIFPNARHGYGADTKYMTRRRWDYFVKHLMGAVPPKEYELK